MNNAPASISAQVTATPVLPPLAAESLLAPAFTLSNGTARLSVPTPVANYTYQLQRSYDLSANSRVNIGSPLAGAAALQLTDTPSASQPKVFCRFTISP